MGRSYTVRMKLHRMLLSVALLAVCSASFAQWQWVDKDGRKVFSDRAPPPDILEKDIIKRPRSAPAAPAVAASPAGGVPNVVAPAPALAASGPLPGGVDKDLEARKKAALEAETSKRRAEEERLAKNRAENCKRAKQAKATLDSGVRLSHTNAAGEVEPMDDATRANESRQAQVAIDSECK